MKTKKGIVHLISLVLILAVLLVAAYFLYTRIVQKRLLKPQQPTVELKTEYNNPFDKSAQYVNPFSEYKNPLDATQ